MGILIVLALALAACSGPKDAFECASSASCRNGGAAGTCESTGFCSFPDPSCPDGSRYGAAAGGYSNQCVGATTGSDAGSDGSGSDSGVVDQMPHALGTWATTAQIPVGRYTFAGALDGSNFYVIGGISGSTGHADVYFATGNPGAVFANAAVSGWTLTTALPAARWTTGGAYDAGYVYVFGGRITGSGDTADVLSAQVNTDGTLGTWTATTAMPQTIRCEAIASSGPNVYIIGGKRTGQGTPQSAVLHATLSGGTVGTWQLAGGTLDTTVFNAAAVVVNGYLYVIGGCVSGNDGCDIVLDYVEYAKINADGSLGSFAHTAPLPAARWHHTAAVSANGDIYVLGGRTGKAFGDPSIAEVVAAHPNADGTIGGWHAMTPLPTPRNRASAAVIGNYLVLFHTTTQAVAIQ